MRKGSNPAKKKTSLELESYHRIIIPVYIPNLKEDYFKDGLKILKICIESLLHTIHSKTRISIINNSSCKEVVEYLDYLYNNHSNVDQLVHSKINLGKVNALYSIIKSNLEPLLTIADADVMFLPNWQKEVEKVFQYMPEAGMVSPVPSSKAFSSRFLNSTIFYAFFKGKLKFSKVENPEGMINFQKSIGRESMYNKNHLSKYLTVENNKIKAVLGCGHFVATMRAEVFHYSPKEICTKKIVSGSESNYIDKPNDKAGFLRLATMGNFAYHLGNKVEKWMFTELKKIKNQNTSENFIISFPKVKQISKLGFFIGFCINFILFRKFRKFFLKIKGMKNDY